MTKAQTYVRRVETQDKNCESIFLIIWGQYITAMKNKLQLLENYQKRRDGYNCVWILK